MGGATLTPWVGGRPFFTPPRVGGAIYAWVARTAVGKPRCGPAWRTDVVRPGDGDVGRGDGERDLVGQRAPGLVGVAAADQRVAVVPGRGR
jgi:hypothetical protein